MTPVQLQQTEAQLERAVVDLAKFNGWLVYHTRNSRGSEPGFPDLVLVRGARLVFAELKTGKGRVSPAQKVWLDALTGVADEAADRAASIDGEWGAGDSTEFQTHVEVATWRPSDWPEIERTLAR